MQTYDRIIKRYSASNILQAAKLIVSEQIVGTVFESPASVKDFLQIKLAKEEREHFMVVFLSAKHQVIAEEIMFSGTLSQTSVYPREVVKRALKLNAGAVILAHNHPSGSVEPSRADEYLTQHLKTALALVDVRVLDHIIVGSGAMFSFAERGLL